MKTHYEYDKKHIGMSDIASLTLRGPSMVGALNFGSDGDYSAYIVDENCIIPENYEMRLAFKEWVKIYDDEGLAFSASAKEIKVYRRGDFGCIIQLIEQGRNHH